VWAIELNVLTNVIASLRCRYELFIITVRPPIQSKSVW